MGTENRDNKSRTPVIGFGPRNIVFVRVRRVDERGKTLEQVKAEMQEEVRKQTSFLAAMYRQGRVVALLGTNVSKSWSSAYREIADRPGMLVGTFFQDTRGGRILTAYFLNVPKDCTYDDLAGEMHAHENLWATAGEKHLRASDMIAEYNKAHGVK